MINTSIIQVFRTHTVLAFTTVMAVAPLISFNVALADAPYPLSTVIERVDWNMSSPKTRIAPKLAVGSDIWATTWAVDGSLYTGFGDGGGFGGSNDIGRVSIGVSVVRGTPENLVPANVWGGLNPASKNELFTVANGGGKPGDLLALNDKLYMAVSDQSGTEQQKVCESTTAAVTWFCPTNWPFGLTNATVTGLWSSMSFLQFGQNYAGARDNYVYVYSHKDGTASPRFNILLGRVPKDQIMTRSAYEFFSGLDTTGAPTWSSIDTDSKPIFTNHHGVEFGRMVMYHPGLNRYLLTSAHNKTGGWGIFDAPNPWGPWTTVFYSDNNWLDGEYKFAFSIPAKWISGNDFVMIFSGTGKYDDWNTVAGTFVLRAGGLPTPPTGVTVNVTPAP